MRNLSILVVALALLAGCSDAESGAVQDSTDAGERAQDAAEGVDGRVAPRFDSGVAAEDAGTPIDTGVSQCGDGNCQAETCKTCPDDCGTCTSPDCDNGAPISLGQHPVAKLQPTVTGRIMRDTEGWNGLVYWGYGDYSDNTGPIPVVAYDPANGTFTETLLTFQTEEIARFRPIAGTLYAPATDPRGSQDVGFATATPAQTWTQHALAPATRPVHAYDIAERVPGDLYLTGSADAPHTYDYGTGYTHGGATVWRSQDGGKTWTIILVANRTGSGFNRFYNVGALDGRIYVQEPGTTDTWVWDGSSWIHGPSLSGFTSDPHFGRGKPVLFGGGLVWLNSSTLVTFDGTDVTTVRSSVTAHELADGRMLIVSDGKLYSSTNLSTWTCHGIAPAGTVSVGLLNGVPYFGSGDANVYGYDRSI